jgi:peptidyl-prolyl cis-trans isomerase A (cyclophilin A)
MVATTTLSGYRRAGRIAFIRCPFVTIRVRKQLMPVKRICLTLLAALLAAGCSSSSPATTVPAGPAPDSFRVAFATSRGTFVVQANRAWAPHGVDRFYQLVGEGFFDENRFYRVLPGFIAQFGANDDPKRNKAWEAIPLPDDSARQHNVRGTVSYAHLGPGTRTHQLFVNLKDNPNLDREGFAPIGRVVDGMAVADSLYAEYGEDPRYQLIATMGNKYLARMFPKLDYIVTARVVEK